MYQYVLWDMIVQCNLFIFYNDYVDFQQINVILGNVGVGIGGVIEALKNWVIMFFVMLYQQIYYVLGYELVYVFQYNMIFNGDFINL